MEWKLFCVLAFAKFSTSQTTGVTIIFGDLAEASVVAANPIATTYEYNYTVSCRSHPCSPLTVGTNIIVAGPSTAAQINFEGTVSESFECDVTTSLTTGTCDYYLTKLGTTVSSVYPMSSDYLQWEPLTVTAGLGKLQGASTTVPPITSTTTTTIAVPGDYCLP
jgi:hypothetical protein